MPACLMKPVAEDLLAPEHVVPAAMDLRPFRGYAFDRVKRRRRGRIHHDDIDPKPRPAGLGLVSTSSGRIRRRTFTL